MKKDKIHLQEWIWQEHRSILKSIGLIRSRTLTLLMKIICYLTFQNLQEIDHQQIIRLNCHNKAVCLDSNLTHR